MALEGGQARSLGCPWHWQNRTISSTGFQPTEKREARLGYGFKGQSTERRD